MKVQLFKNIKQELLNQISESKESLKIAVTWFTNYDLYSAILEKLENSKFHLQLIVLNDHINNKKEGINFQKLIDLNAEFYYSNSENMVHHKFCIIDNKIVITGSYNWTYYAENRNWENIIILNDELTVRAYTEEFEKVISHHERIQKISEKQNLSISINSNDYLKTDYLFQAISEIQKGNDLVVAKIYTELLKFDTKNKEIAAARTEILKKYNGSEEFEVSPFEIGLQYHSGYQMAIPAFEPLPFTIIKGGRTLNNNQTNVLIKVQKFDLRPKTILELTLANMKASPAGTEKIEHIITLNKNGVLTIECREVGGYHRSVSSTKNIKTCL